MDPKIIQSPNTTDICVFLFCLLVGIRWIPKSNSSRVPTLPDGIVWYLCFLITLVGGNEMDPKIIFIQSPNTTRWDCLIFVFSYYGCWKWDGSQNQIHPESQRLVCQESAESRHSPPPKLHLIKVVVACNGLQLMLGTIGLDSTTKKIWNNFRLHCQKAGLTTAECKQDTPHATRGTDFWHGKLWTIDHHSPRPESGHKRCWLPASSLVFREATFCTFNMRNIGWDNTWNTGWDRATISSAFNMKNNGWGENLASKQTTRVEYRFIIGGQGSHWPSLQPPAQWDSPAWPSSQAVALHDWSRLPLLAWLTVTGSADWTLPVFCRKFEVYEYIIYNNVM